MGWEVILSGHMDYTEQQAAEFKERFVEIRRRQRLVGIPVLVAILAFALAANAGQGMIFGVPATSLFPVILFVILGAVFYHWRTWRCPACGEALGGSQRLKFCQMCGVRLAD